MNDSTETKWYLLQCKSRQEVRAQENLCRQGYHYFAPTLRTEKIQCGKRVSVTELLFPGYLFIQLSRINDNWAPIRSTRGVSRIVCFNGDATSVPQEVMDHLLMLENPSGEAEQALKQGDSLRIIGGPFNEFEAVFHAYNGDERVFVLLNIMQQQQKLSIPIKDLKTL